MRFSLAGSATAVRFGSLDSDPYMDLAVAAGGRLDIVHGWGRKDSPALESRIERLGSVSGVRGISIGYFLRDRDGRNEIAAAFSDGAVRMLIPDGLDTRPPTARTIQLRAAARVKATRVKRQETESKPAWRSSTSSGWDVGPSIARGAGGALPQNLLTSAKLSLLDTDDLLVANAGGGFDLVPASVSTGDSRTATRKVAAAVDELNAAVDAPTAVLAMPQKVNGDRGIVALSAEGVSASIVTLAPSTLTVDRLDDPAGAGLTAASACTAAANDCSLRGAVQFANIAANAGSTIVLGANTYTLSINGDRGCVGGGEPAATGNTVGDLELQQSTTITGAGAAQTIIRQTGTGSATAPGDRVMCLNTLFLVGLQYNFSGLTITGGREGGTIGGGGIIGGELNNSLTLSGVTLSNNQDANSGLGGGGIQLTGGSLTITNSLIGGSSAPCTAASPTCASGTDRNNVNLANSAQTSGGGVNYTPSSPMHTGGTGTLTVTGTTVTRNTSSGIGGGGFDLYIFAFALPGGIGSGSASISTSTISNNQALGSGGGIVVESLPTTVASSTVTSNSAANAGGGIYVGGGGLTLDGTTLPGVTISGNTAPGGGSTIATTFNVTVQGTNVTLGGDVLIGGGGNWTNSPGSVISPTNVVISGGTFNANDSTTNMGGNFTFGPTPGNEIAFPGTFNSGTGTFNFNGSGAQSIIGPNSPTFNNLVVNKPSGTLTLGVNSSVKSNLTVTSGVFDLGAFTANRTAAGGALTVSNGATLKIGGANSLPTNYQAHALGPSSTVEYAGALGQTITATNYGHLTSSSTGARTLPSSGTVGVAGAFTPGTNAYTVTGSTVNFNGAGAQTIPAFGYNNLTSSSTGARTLASSGTVGVAGTFTPGTNAYTVTGSTVNFNGSGAQTIPAFGYNNLTSSSTGARTLASSGTVGVAGAFTPGTNAYTVTGSTVDFNGAGASDDSGVWLQQPDEQLDGGADAGVERHDRCGRDVHAGHERVHGDRQHGELQQFRCADDSGVWLQQPDEQLDGGADAGVERHRRCGRDVHAGHERVHGHGQHGRLQRLRCADDSGVRLQQPDEQLDRRADAGVERHGRRRRDVHARHERLHGHGQHGRLQRRGCADDSGVRLQQPDEQLDWGADAGVERHGRRGGGVHAGHERLHGHRQHRELQRLGCADDPGVRLQQPDEQLDRCADAGVERHRRRRRDVHAGHERVHGHGQHGRLQRLWCADDSGVRLQQPDEQLDGGADAGVERHDRRRRDVHARHQRVHGGRQHGRLQWRGCADDSGVRLQQPDEQLRRARGRWRRAAPWVWAGRSRRARTPTRSRAARSTSTARARRRFRRSLTTT